MLKVSMLSVLFSFYQRYRDVTARIKASSCPSIPPLPHALLAAIDRQMDTNNSSATNDDVQTRCLLPMPDVSVLLQEFSTRFALKLSLSGALLQNMKFV